jgi:hypothetical protein
VSLERLSAMLAERSQLRRAHDRAYQAARHERLALEAAFEVAVVVDAPDNDHLADDGSTDAQVPQPNAVEQPDNCSICLYEITAPVRVNECRHTYCQVCIDELVARAVRRRRRPRCPICRGFMTFGQRQDGRLFWHNLTAAAHSHDSRPTC